MEETQNNKQRNSASTEPDRIGEKLWLENTRNSGLLEVSSRKVTASSSVQDVVLWAIRGQFRVGGSGLCEETEQKTKTEKLGRGCRTGVREETVGGSCWKDAIGLCCLKRVMSGFTKVSCQCVQAVASFGRNPYRPGQNKRTENKQRNSASSRSRTGYGYSVKMPTSWFWGKFGCVCLPQISGRGHILADPGGAFPPSSVASKRFSSSERIKEIKQKAEKLDYESDPSTTTSGRSGVLQIVEKVRVSWMGLAPQV